MNSLQARYFQSENIRICIALSQRGVPQELSAPLNELRMHASNQNLPGARASRAVVDSLLTEHNLMNQVQNLLSQETCHVEIQEVIPGVFIGDREAAEDKDYLLEMGITHILRCDYGRSPFPLDFAYKLVDIADRECTVLFPYFAECNQFILQGSHGSNRVLVHCAAGISRSAAFVCAYLIATFSLSFPEALGVVQSARPFANPNPGFCSQLETFAQLNTKRRI